MKTLTFVFFAYIALQPLCAQATRQELTPMLYQGTNHLVTGFRPSREMHHRYRENRHLVKITSSSNGKGYWVELAVRGNRLFVTYLDVHPKNIDAYLGGSSTNQSSQPPSRTKENFGVEIPENGLFAAWFSGNITEPLGKRILMWSNITERVRVYYFKKGILVDVKERESDYIIEQRRKKQGKDSANTNVDHISGSQ